MFRNFAHRLYDRVRKFWEPPEGNWELDEEEDLATFHDGDWRHKLRVFGRLFLRFPTSPECVFLLGLLTGFVFAFPW